MCSHNSMQLEPDWPAPDNIRALVSLRGSDPEQILAEQFPGFDVCRLQQVHGIDAVDANNAETGTEADACFTRTAAVVCRVASADCLPLLVCNRAGTEVAAIHAGWRGLAAGVIESTVSKLQTDPSELLVWLGPAISQAHFEVGAEVRDSFMAQAPRGFEAQTSDAFEAHGSKYMADLYALARARLQSLGCTAIYGGGLCTYADPARFYSWRRDAGQARLYSMIGFLSQ